MAQSPSPLDRWLGRVVTLRPGETRALLWSFAYFFCLLAGYYVLRPLRDEMGIAGGVRNLPWLFTATFVVMLAAVPIYGAAVTRLARRQFIPLVYHFFVANIALFWLLLILDIETVTVARVFFVWTSVFVLFVVSVFWSFMADLYDNEQSKRLFGFIAAGGSAGALLGPAITVSLVGSIGPVNLLLAAGLLLELAVLCALRLEAAAPRPAAPEPRPVTDKPASEKLGGGWLDGFALLARSRYLASIALWVALLSFAATFLYYQQAAIVAESSTDPAVRTRIFATIELAVGLLSFATQFFATGRLIARFGVGAALALLPVVFVIGFTVIAIAPVLAAVIAFQVIQRFANFAIANPARESLFTVVARDEKYKAKNVIDTVWFRGADAAFGWVFEGLRASGLGHAAISFIAVPISALWLLLAVSLGRSRDRQTPVTPVLQTDPKGA